MNTNTAILKWDVTVQKGLLVINTLGILVGVVCHPFLYLVLILQFVEGFYQLISNGMHLRFPHKSIGYRKFRIIHFWGSIIFLILFGLVLAHEPGEISMIFITLIIPQTIFYCYFALCYSELKYLNHREFHILR